MCILLRGCLCALLITAVPAYEQVHGRHIYSTQEDIYLYQDASEILKSKDKLYLYQAPGGGWTSGNSMCIFSSLVSIHDEKNTVLRTIEYWSETRFTKLHFLMKAQTGRGQQPVIKALDVGNNEYATFPPEPPSKGHDQKSNEPASAPTLKPRSLYEFGKLHEKPVLYASNRCVLLGTMSSQDSTLWIPGKLLNSPPKPCVFMMLALCGPRTYMAYQSEQAICKGYVKQFQTSTYGQE
uniref:Putative secreted protein n=1 Tax=Amblyomma americanum TaxID=6943 RepID=A0A0C9RY46_AMBAM